jgi:hypothetical protein
MEQCLLWEPAAALCPLLSPPFNRYHVCGTILLTRTAHRKKQDIFIICCDGEFFNQVIYFQKCMYMFITHGILVTTQDSFFLAHCNGISSVQANGKGVRQFA